MIIKAGNSVEASIFRSGIDSRPIYMSINISGLVKLVGWDTLTQRGSNVTADIQTSSRPRQALTHMLRGQPNTPLLLYMPFVYLVRSSNS